MTKKFNYEQELAELREETESLLEEIEKLEDEIHEKKYKSDCSVAMEMMKTYFEEANKAGISNYDAMALLSIFSKVKED